LIPDPKMTQNYFIFEARKREFLKNIIRAGSPRRRR
jgi:hypothetical protein